jgi:hypothetical protein
MPRQHSCRWVGFRHSTSRCIDKVCRMPESHKSDVPCDCLQGCHFQNSAGRDMSCQAGRCTTAPCSPCGTPKGNRQCCGTGVLDHDGNCHCATGAGEGCAVQPQHCDSGAFNDVYYYSGKNNGRCCATGTCDTDCTHQPK